MLHSSVFTERSPNKQTTQHTHRCPRVTQQFSRDQNKRGMFCMHVHSFCSKKANAILFQLRFSHKTSHLKPNEPSIHHRPLTLLSVIVHDIITGEQGQAFEQFLSLKRVLLVIVKETGLHEVEINKQGI